MGDGRTPLARHVAASASGLSFQEIVELLSSEHQRVLEANFELERANRHLRCAAGLPTPPTPALDAMQRDSSDARKEGALQMSWPVDVDAPAKVPSRLPPVHFASHAGGVNGSTYLGMIHTRPAMLDQAQLLERGMGDTSPAPSEKLSMGPRRSLGVPAVGMKQAPSSSSNHSTRRRLPGAGLKMVTCTAGPVTTVQYSRHDDDYDDDPDAAPRLTMGGSVDLRSLKARDVQRVDTESDSSASSGMDGVDTVRSGNRHRSVFGANGMRVSLESNQAETVQTSLTLGPRETSRTKVLVQEFRAKRLSMVVQMMKLSVGKSGGKSNRPWIQRHLINPEHSRCLETWDMITLWGLAFVAIVTPVQVSMIEPKFDWMLGVNCFVDSIFFVDLILQFFLMFPKRTDYGYALESDHKKIVRAYVKSWFIIDLMSIVPFDLVGLLSRSDGLQQMKVVKVIRLMRLLKLVRMLKASRLFRRFEVRMSITYGTFALLKFFMILVLITHWLANLWALTLVLVDESDNIPRWIDGFADLEKNVSVKTKDSPWKLYVVCLYFTSYTITSVGYGDIGPQNIVETIVCTMMIVVAGISWAVVLGEVCGIISNLNSDERAFRGIMDELNYMMNDRVIPSDMRRRLRNFFLSNKLAQRRARHQRIIEAMSPGLQGEVIMELNRVWITKVSFLNSILSDAEGSSHGSYFYGFVVDVSMKMESACHAQSEVFGQMQALYILSRGLVSRHGRLYSAGAVWGIDFVLSDRRLLEPSDCLALTYVEAMFLRRSLFLELVELHKGACPGLKRKVRRFCCWLALQRALMKEARRRRRRIERKARKLEEQQRELEALTRGDGYLTPDDTRSEERQTAA